MITESRGLNFAVNLYKYILTMVLVLGGTDYIYFWMITACVVLIPYGVVVAMKVNLIIGRAMDITDEDLYKAMSCIGLGPLMVALGITIDTSEDKDEASESGSSSNHSDAAESETLLSVEKDIRPTAPDVATTNIVQTGEDAADELESKIATKEAEAKALKAAENTEQRKRRKSEGKRVLYYESKMMG